MTPENDSFDELASAYLDGELSAPERAQVEADPAILARVQVFERVRHAVATQMGAPAETRRENALVAAMDAMDEALPEVKWTPAGYRQKGIRRLRWQTGAGWGAAAAAVALLVVLVASLGGEGGGDASSAAAPVTAAAGRSQLEAATAHDSAAATSAPSGGASSLTSQSGDVATAAPNFAKDTPPLGNFSDVESLARASDPMMLPAPAIARCDGQVVAALEWNNQPAELVERLDGSRVVVASDCAVLASVPRSVPVPTS